MSKNLYLVILLIGALIGNIQGQDKKPVKKVIVVEKTDVNGKVTETRKEAVGAEADELLKSLDNDEATSINIVKGDEGNKVIKISKTITNEIRTDEDSNKEIEITTDKINGKKEKYKIITKEGDQEKIIEWDGTGEMPGEMAKLMKNIKITKQLNGDNMTISVDDEGDELEKDIVIINGHPKGKRQKMEWQEQNDNSYFPEKRRNKMHFSSDKPNTNKATLGIMIDDTDQGVVIADIVEGSAASKSGLRRGDTILKVNDKYIFTSNGLLEALRPFNPSEKVKVRYIREGKEKCTKATLQGK
jgi:hypothetical protein